MFRIFYTIFVVFLIIGCSRVVSTTNSKIPAVYKESEDGNITKKDIKVSVFRLNNYTDTPRAGMRASNIIEGILRSKGYIVISHVKDKALSFKKAKKIAKKDGSKYFVYGGVSEWRYKTGIDGEPSVSLQIGLYKTKKGKLVWSGVGSDSDWGNGSIGTLAQDLILEMFEE